VASDVGGIAEVIEHGRTGMRVPENDEAAFAQTVMQLIVDREFAGKLGRAARESVGNEHSIQSAVRNVERVYREVLGR
jgi:glycosyltransferase involved in cell wall biosynthesis